MSAGDADMDKGVGDLIDEIVQMTEQMLSFAQKDQWDEVIVREQQRNPHFQKVFNNPQSQDTAELRKFILDILEMDRQIMELAKKTKIQLVSQINKLDTGKQANQAYLKTQNGR